MFRITGSPKHNPLYSVPLSQRSSCPHPSILFYTAPHTVIKSSQTTFPSRHRNLSNTHQLHLWKKVAPRITAKTDTQRRFGHSQNAPAGPTTRYAPLRSLRQLRKDPGPPPLLGREGISAHLTKGGTEAPPPGVGHACVSSAEPKLPATPACGPLGPGLPRARF